MPATIVLLSRRLKQPRLEGNLHDFVKRPFAFARPSVCRRGRGVVFCLVFCGGSRCVTAPAATIGTFGWLELLSHARPIHRTYAWSWVPCTSGSETLMPCRRLVALGANSPFLPTCVASQGRQRKLWLLLHSNFRHGWGPSLLFEGVRVAEGMLILSACSAVFGQH